VIGVFLVAASARTRRELEFMFNGSDVAVVGSATDMETASEELSDRDVDIVLVNIDTASREELIDSIEDTQLARETPIVFLMEQGSADLVRRVAKAGVKGILTSEIDAQSLIRALKAVASGFLVVSPEESALIQTTVGTRSEAEEALEPLTTREKEVLQKMADGLANKEIAVRLNISEHTVKFHVASIMGKLGASSRTEAVSIGMRNGLILF
jgi:two-component system, NarL family, response regulator YdfI